MPGMDVFGKPLRRTKEEMESLVEFFHEFGCFLSRGFSFLVRKARWDDLDAIFGMYFNKRNNRYLLHNPMKRTDFKGIWKEMLARKYSFVYEEKGRIMGFISAIAKEGQERHVAHITPIVVRCECVGRGIGRRMMKHLLKMLRDDGFRRIELIVNSDNRTGLDFFRRLGFAKEATLKMGTRRGRRYYDDYLMVKFF